MADASNLTAGGLRTEQSRFAAARADAHSRPLRYLIVTFVVAAYIALGFQFRLNIAEYQVLGVPIMLAFQLGFARQPLRALWVRAAPPVRMDGRFLILWVLFSLLPIYAASKAAARRDMSDAALYGVAIAGAFGLAYALQAMQWVNVRHLGLCLLTAGGIGIAPLLLVVFLPHVLHVHFRFGPSNSAVHPGILSSLTVGARTLLIGLPLGFIVEEVFFRGALDAYLHRGEEGVGWFSACFISALWGVWHLPGQTIAAGRLFPTVAGLVVAQIAVGVPLSLWWRKSGNLTVNNTTHAVLDAVRGMLAPFA